MKRTILITSASSGVGLSVLESLRNRREKLQIIGISTESEDENLRECDVGLESPPTASPDFVPFVEDLCRQHDIELVIPGRDDDSVALSYQHDNPRSMIKLSSGPGELLRIFRDKHLSSIWAKKFDLPFCPTVSTNEDDYHELTNVLISQFGFPLVFKPLRGEGSKGVHIVFNENQLRNALTLKDYAIQPFLSRAPLINAVPNLEYGIPLWWNFPEIHQGVVVVVSHIEKKKTKHFTCVVKHRQGFVHEIWLDESDYLSRTAARIADAISESRFIGIVSFSLVQSPRDEWKIIEINPRFTGSTSGRVRLGFDEVAITINNHFQEELVPLSNMRVSKIGSVKRRYRDPL